MTNNKLMSTAEKAAETLSGNNTAGFEIYVRGSSSTSVEVKEQKLDAFEESQTWGVGIRVLLADGRMGFAYSTGSEDAVKEAAAKAFENAGNSEPDDGNVIPSKPDAAYPDFEEYDEGALGVPEQKKIDYAMEVERAARAYDPRIVRIRKASASFSEAEWVILSSSGIKVSSRGTYFSCGVMAVAEEEHESQMGYEFDYKRRLGEMDYGWVGTNAARQAIGLLGAKKSPTGLYPVILENTVTSEFLGVLSASFSADALIKGRSLLAGKVGAKVCSPLINIYDDGLLPGGAGSKSFDDEGIPCRRTPLIVNGVFSGFLHNAYTAKRTGGVSTGNAVRGGFRSQPSVGSNNLYIEKGNATKDELISGVSSGLMVQEVLGMHTANPISGDFSVGVSGQWIEGGKVVYPVREAAISGNILSLFSEVETVGSDLRLVGRIGAPSILLKPLSVSGS